MGAYDDLLEGMPKKTGTYDDLLAEVGKEKPKNGIVSKVKQIASDVIEGAKDAFDDRTLSEKGLLTPKDIDPNKTSDAVNGVPFRKDYVDSATQKDRIDTNNTESLKTTGNAGSRLAKEIEQGRNQAVNDSINKKVANKNKDGYLSTPDGVENNAGNWVKGLGTSFVEGAEAAKQGVRSQYADVIGSKSMADDANKKTAQSQLNIQTSTPEIESPLFNAVYGGLSSTLRSAPGIVASIATKSVVPALAAAGFQTEAEAYGKYKERGATGIQALTGALGEGSIEVMTELMPMNYLVEKFGKANAAKLIGGFIAKDALPEQVATLTQDAIDTAIANPNKTWGEYLAERPSAAFNTLIATVVQAGVIGGASKIASMAGKSQTDNATPVQGKSKADLIREKAKLAKEKLDAVKANNVPQNTNADLVSDDDLASLLQDETTPVDAPTPEPTNTLEAQATALNEGRKPAILLTEGEQAPSGLDTDVKAAETDRGTLLYKDDAVLEQAQSGDLGGALNYGISEKPQGATDVITARDENGTVIQDVLTDGSQSVVDSAQEVAGINGTVEQRPTELAIAEREQNKDPLFNLFTAKKTELDNKIATVNPLKSVKQVLGYERAFDYHDAVKQVRDESLPLQKRIMALGVIDQIENDVAFKSQQGVENVSESNAIPAALPTEPIKPSSDNAQGSVGVVPELSSGSGSADALDASIQQSNADGIASAPNDAVITPNLGTNVPNSVINTLKQNLDKAESEGDLESMAEIGGQLTYTITQDTTQAISNGEMPIFKTGKNSFIAISPSAQNEGKIQVTRYNSNGIMGDSQYNSIEEAVSSEGIYQQRESEQSASDLLKGSLNAEMEFNNRKSQTEPLGNSEELPAAPAETPKAKKPKKSTGTLLAKLRTLGGIKLSDKLDVTGEDKKFIGGGYNQIFKGNAKQSLRGLIESGDLDEYLPFNMRLQNGTSNDAYDSTEAYDYLADKIKNGDRVLTYEAEQEIIASKHYDSVEDAEKDVKSLTDDELNALLQEAGYEQRESDTEARIFEQENENTTSTSGEGTPSRNEPRAETEARNEVTETPRSNAKSAEREGVRPLVELITKRRAAAQQIGKSKQFDDYLKAAKEFMAGKEVKPTRFKLASTTFKNDAPLSEAYTKLAEMAKTPAKEVRQEKSNFIESIKAKIGEAKTVKVLNDLSREIQANDALTDSQYAELDDAVMSAIDALDNSTISKTETVVAENATTEKGLPKKSTPLVDLTGKQKKVWFNRFDKETNKVVLDVVFKNNGKSVQDEIRVTKEVYSDRFVVAESEKDANDKRKKLESTTSLGGRDNNESRSIVQSNVDTNDTTQERVDETENNRQDFTLAGETNAEILAKEKAKKEAEEATAKAEKDAQDAKDKAAAEEAQRVNAGERPFVFGEDDSIVKRDVKSGVDDMFTRADAIEAIKADDTIPKAEKIRLASELRQGTITADDVNAVVESKPNQETNEEPQAPITDFGEKLEGARKDQLKAMSRDMSDAEIAEQPFSKIWPKLDVNAIENKFHAAFDYLSRQEVPNKPRTKSRLRSWVERVKLFRSLTKEIFESKNEQQFKDRLLSSYGLDALKTFNDKLKVLLEVERNQWDRIGKVLAYPTAFRIDENGKSVINPYVYVEIDGVRNIFGGDKTVEDVFGKIKEKLSNEKKETEQKIKFEIRRYRSTQIPFIMKTGDKEHRPLKMFDAETTSSEVKEYLDNNYDEILNAWEAVKQSDNVTKADMRRSSNEPRKGEDYRNGKDVTEEQFQNAFGFRGVEFGNWVGQGKDNKERQGMLNQAYDALMDLSKILNIPSKAISLDGTLGLAFGSRGKGSASAHYESQNVVINLTKTKGDSAIAHEWFHALDNYFAKQRGEVSFKDVGFNQQRYREEAYITYKPEPMMRHKKGLTKPMTKAQLTLRQEQNPNSGFFKDENWEVDPNHKSGVRVEVEKKFADLVNALNSSPMRSRAFNIDGFKDLTKDGYWSRIIEVGARSFENYVISKMMKQGYQNDYLANVTPADEFSRNLAKYPYLLPEEMPVIEQAFDNLFAEIKTKETDNGNVAMFSRSADKEITGKSTVTQYGNDFETGKPVTFNYAHNTFSATKLFGKPNKDSQFNRGYEPSGEYVTAIDEVPSEKQKGYEYGSITLNNPLVIENDSLNWKKSLSNSFGGLTGKKLSLAIINAGYDGVVTTDGAYTSEIINLQTFDEAKALFSRTSDSPIFYSALTKAIEAIPQKKGDRVTWKGLIKNLAQKGVKHDEIEWTGVNEWLDLQTGSVTKEQLTDYLNGNGVQVTEPRNKKKPVEIKNSAVEMYTNGLSSIAISKLLNVSESAVLTWVRSAGVVRTQEETKVPYEKIKNALDFYNAGNSIAESAKLAKIGRSTLQKVLDNSNLSRGVLVVPDAVKQSAIDLYNSGISAAEVAKPLGISTSFVQRAVRSLGATRGMSEAQALRVANGRLTGYGIKAKFKSNKNNAELKADSVYELARFYQLENDDAVESFSRSKDRIPYGDNSNYVPDIEVIYKDGTKAVEEIKPAFRVEDEKVQAKAQGAKRYYSDKDIEYKIITEFHIGLENFDKIIPEDAVDNEADAKRIKASLASVRWALNKPDSITPEMREKVMGGLPLFSRSDENSDSINNSENEVDDNEILRSIDSLQEAVRRHVNNRPARISKSLPINQLARDGGGRGFGSAKSWQLTNELAKFFGQKVITFENNTPNIFAFDGVSYRGNIFLNTKASRPAHVVFGHEFLHRLRSENQAAYDKLVSVIEPLITDLKVFGKKEKIEDGFSNDYIKEELLANLVGNRFHEVSFWRKLAIKAPKQFKAIADTAIKLISQVKAYFSGNQTLNGDEFITDLDKARQAIEDAVLTYKKLTGDKSEISFSRTTDSNQASLTPQWESLEDSKFDNAIRALQDKHVDLKRVTQKIKAAGGMVTDKFNAYLQEELYHGRTAKRTKEFIDNELTPLIEDMRERGVSMADFEFYLWARHAEERNAQIAKINPDMPDGGSGLTTEEANNWIKNLSSKDKINLMSLEKRIDAINKKSQQVLIEYGLESQSTLNAWNGAYKHYVPLMREDMDKGGMGTGQGFSVKGNASKRAMGSTRNVVDIIANIAQQRERNIVRGEKNRVSSALIGMAKLNPNPDFWTVDKPPTIKTVRKGIDGNDTVIETIDPNYKNRENVVTARFIDKQGRAVETSVVFNEFNERALKMAASIKNLELADTGVLLEHMAKVTRYFASINTQYNPVFGVLNIVRDVQGSLLNLTTTPLAGKQKEVLGHTMSALKGIYQDIRSVRKGKGSTNSEWAQLWEEFQKEGGQTGYRDMFANASERTESLKKSLDPEWWAKTKLGKVISINGALVTQEQILKDKVIAPVFNWLSDYNETLENAVRLSVYKVAKDKGISNAQAASLAKNISVNFNRKGTSARTLGSMYAFFNAAVQGSARIAETLSGKRGKQIVMGGIALGAIQALALAMAGYDDEEPPEFVRDRNIVIPLDFFGADQKYATIPMPLGFNALPNFGRILTEWALSGCKDTGRRITHIFEMLLDVTNPIGGSGTPLNILAPTMIDPLVDLSQNKDFTGRPIAKKDFDPMAQTAGHTRAKDTATPWAKGISKSINWMTGGTDYVAGAVSPTPDQIDYFIEQLTGGVGRETSKVAQTVTSIATGEDLPTYKIPLAGRFYGDADGQSSESGAFYANLERINRHQTQIKGMRADRLDVTDYLKENPEARLVGLADMNEKLISRLRKQKRKLIESDADKAMVKSIDDRMKVKMKQFNDRVTAIESDGRLKLVNE